MDKLFRLNSELPTVASGTKLIKSADCEKLFEATAIIQAAQNEAKKIVDKAEAVYKERYEQGYTDGIEAGKMEHAEKMMDTVIASVDFISKIESTVVSVVNQAIRKIIGDLNDNERIVRIVSAALNNVRGQQKVTVRVSTQDEPAVSKALEAMTAGSYLTVIADIHLSPNQCILESELGVVDASLDTQLKALEYAFSSKLES